MITVEGLIAEIQQRVENYIITTIRSIKEPSLTTIY